MRPVVAVRRIDCFITTLGCFVTTRADTGSDLGPDVARGRRARIAARMFRLSTPGAALDARLEEQSAKTAERDPSLHAKLEERKAALEAALGTSPSTAARAADLVASALSATAWSAAACCLASNF